MAEYTRVDETKSPDDYFAESRKRIQRKNLIMLLASSMCFKFSMETVTTSFSNTMLSRLPKGEGAQVWAILLVFYGISQSISSTMVSRLMIRFPANKIVSVALWAYAALILAVMILEASTGGTLTTQGQWKSVVFLSVLTGSRVSTYNYSLISPYILYGFYIAIGLCFGCMEVGRKVIPPMILGDRADGDLVKLDAAIHIAYEIAGTAGAFASTPITKFFGFVYALFHLPLLFTVSGIIFWFMKIDHEPSEDEKGTDEKASFFQPVRSYFASLWLGAKIVTLKRSYNFLLLSLVVPQILHRVYEGLIIPVYCQSVIGDGSLQGLTVGGSNLGELLGALMVYLTNKCISNPLWWVRADAISVNLLWIMPFITLGSQVGWAFVVAASFVVISGTWAAGDISVLAYIQDSLPEKVKDPKINRGFEVSPLGSVMGFLYACYSLLIAITLFALGSSFRGITDPDTSRRLFIFVACIPSTAIGILIIVNTFFARLADKDAPEFHWLPPSCLSCCKRKRKYSRGNLRALSTVELSEPLIPGHAE